MSAEQWWWLSFADPELPRGEQFLGVCVIQAPNFMAAHRKSEFLGLNPGGELKAYPLDRAPAPAFRDRLLDRDEAEAAYPGA